MLVLVLVVLLLISGLRQAPIRAYALGAPNQGSVVLLNRGDPPVCEGPINLVQQAGAVRIWAASLGTTSKVRVTVRRMPQTDLPGGPILAAGTSAVTAATGPETTQLDRPLAANVPLSVCVASLGQPVKLLGAGPARATILIHAGRPLPPSDFSLVLLSAVPDVIHRSSRHRRSSGVAVSLELDGAVDGLAARLRTLGLGYRGRGRGGSGAGRGRA